MFLLVAIVLAGLGAYVLYLLISGTAGETNEFIEGICEAAPFLCGGQSQTTTINYDTAKESTEGIVCGIDAVITGNPDRCKHLESDEEDETVTGEAVSLESEGELSVDCEEDLDNAEVYKTEHSSVIAVTLREAENQCKDLCDEKDDCISSLPLNCNKILPNDPLLEYYPNYRDHLYCDCEMKLAKVNVKCTVNNFKLPQVVSKWEEWIPFYGDPHFLIYWNKFPTEEDTWNYRPGWGTFALIGFATVMPLGRGSYIGFKAAWNMLKKTETKEIVLKAFESGSIRQFLTTNEKQILLGPVGKESKEAIKNLAKRLPSTQKKLLTKALMKEELTEMVSNRLLKYQGLKSVVWRGVKLSGPVLVAYIIESLDSRNMAQGNSLTLKQPFEDPEVLDLNDEWDKKPVLIKWRPEIGEEIKTMHLASPCYLSEFIITKDDVICGEFIFREKTDDEEYVLLCTDVDEDPKHDDVSCNDFLELDDKDKEKMERYFEKDVYDIVHGLLTTSDKILFEYEGEEPKKIHIPFFESKAGKTYTIENIELEGTEIEGGPRPEITRKRYRFKANLFINNEDKGEINYDCISYETSEAYDCEYIESKELETLEDFSVKIKLIRDRDEDMFIGIRLVIENGEEVYIDLMDEDAVINDNGRWDTLHISNYNAMTDLDTFLSKWNPFSGDHIITFSDIDGNGNYGYVSMSDCKTEAVILDMGRLSDTRDDDISPNYCLRFESTWDIIRDWGVGIAAGTVVTAASVFTGGFAPTIGAFMAAGLVTSFNAGYTELYKVNWPGD